MMDANRIAADARLAQTSVGAEERERLVDSLSGSAIEQVVLEVDPRQALRLARHLYHQENKSVGGDD